MQCGQVEDALGDLHLHLLAAAGTSPETTAKARPNLRLDRIGIQPEERRRRARLTGGSDGVVRHGEGVKALVGEDGHLAVHAGLQGAVEILERDEHGEHGDVLKHDGLRFDFFHRAAEAAIGKGVDAHGRGLAHGDEADVRFGDERTRAHLGEVGHRDDDAAAADRAGPCLDDLADRDRLRDDGAEHGRLHGSVLQLLGGEVEVGLRAHHLRRRIGEADLRGLELGLGDDPLAEQVLLPLHLRRLDVHVRLGRGEVGFRLLVLVLHVTRVELDDEVARPDERTDLDRHPGDLAGRRARLHFDDVDRLDHAGGGGLDDDVAAGNRDSGNRRHLGVRLGAAGERGDDEGDGQELADHDELRMETDERMRGLGSGGPVARATSGRGQRGLRSAPWRCGHRTGPE